jgi:hypothetical protein
MIEKANNQDVPRASTIAQPAVTSRDNVFTNYWKIWVVGTSDGSGSHGNCKARIDETSEEP